ncbi:MAG TPA: sugar transferase [Nitrolancea sp.]|nr:sugar transferase [Nitrolancea sp.]
MQQVHKRRTGATLVIEAQAGIKRLIDVLISGAALLLLSPLLVLIGLLIRLDSSGPALFRQERVGQDETRFTCFKFRTMYQDADPNVHRLAFQRFAAGQILSDDPDAPYKLAKDNRVTHTGELLRRTSLDELPQLLNVFLGEMSLVGPRPAIPYELETYQEWQHLRHQVKPGLTGLWQVYGRGRVGFEEMMALDVEYATTWSVWLDVKLIALTVPAMLEQRGAR